MASERPARSSSPALLARAWRLPSATSSSVVMAAAAETGFELYDRIVADAPRVQELLGVETRANS